MFLSIAVLFKINIFQKTICSFFARAYALHLNTHYFHPFLLTHTLEHTRSHLMTSLPVLSLHLNTNYFRCQMGGGGGVILLLVYGCFWLGNSVFVFLTCWRVWLHLVRPISIILTCALGRAWFICIYTFHVFVIMACVVACFGWSSLLLIRQGYICVCFNGWSDV
jgi:hypothetical protein